MKRLLFIAASAASLLVPSVTEASSLVVRLSRKSADLYTGPGIVVETEKCTQTANEMLAWVTEPDARGRRWVVFYDELGNEEGDCLVHVVIRAKGV